MSQRYIHSDSGVEQIVYFVRGILRRSKTSIKGRFFEGSKKGGIRGGFMMYLAKWVVLGLTSFIINLDYTF